MCQVATDNLIISIKGGIGEGLRMNVEITHQMTVEEEKEMYRDLYNEQEATNQKLLNENKELKEEIAFLKRVIDKL